MRDASVVAHRPPRSTVNHLVLPLLLVAALAPAAPGQSDADNAFRTELSKLVLGSENPVPAEETGAYRGVAFVPLGAPWALPDEPVEETSDIAISSSRMAAQFNYPVDVRAGVANLQRVETLERLWRRVLSATAPAAAAAAAEDSVLYQKVDRVDEARGARRLHQPSEQYLRYLEYRSASRVLDQSSSNDGAWRLHPRFNEYTTLEEAREAFTEEWKRFGYKVSIESALNAPELRGGGQTWHSARSAFENHTDSIIPDVPVGRTNFFPGESYWRTMRSWRRVTFKAGTTTPITCQLVRVEIQRPWLHLALLSDKSIKIAPGADLGVLSDGAVPTATDFARGRLANVVEELILVRQVRGAAADSDHPLARYEYPEAINPAGYVIRILPKAPAE